MPTTHLIFRFCLDLRIFCVSLCLMNEDKNIIVGFDAKRVVRNGTGLGAYGRNLVNDLAALYPNAQLLLYAPDAGREDLARQVKSAPNLRMVYPKNAKNALKKAAWRSGGMVKDLLRDGVQVACRANCPRALNTQASTPLSPFTTLFLCAILSSTIGGTR